MGDRGTIAYTQPIYRQTLYVKGKDNIERQTVVSYQVTFSVHAYESGDIHPFYDDRSCHFDSTPRQFVRDIVVTEQDGTKRSLASMALAAPQMPSKSFGDNCNNRMPGDYDTYTRELTGDKNSWDVYIQADLPEVQRILSLLGTVTRSG